MASRIPHRAYRVLVNPDKAGHQWVLEMRADSDGRPADDGEWRICSYFQDKAELGISLFKTLIPWGPYSVQWA